MRSVLQDVATSSAVHPNMVEKARDTRNNFSCPSPHCRSSHRLPIMVQGSRFYRCYSAAKCRFLLLGRVAKRVRFSGHKSSVTQQTVSCDNVLWERDTLHDAQMEQLDSQWHHLHQFVWNGKKKRPVLEKDKSHKSKLSTVVTASANVGTLRPGARRG